MSKKLILIPVIGLLCLALSANDFGTLGIEKRTYSVKNKYKNFELRHYPSVIVAEVSELGSSYEVSSKQGFRVLAGYIFGGNERSEKISMTSPVSMQWEEDGGKMQFMMPAEYSMEDLPSSKDSRVLLKENKGGDFAAITFSGWANDKKIKEWRLKLENELQEEGIAFKNEFIYLGYDPPYKFMFRRNEILIPILK